MCSFPGSDASFLSRWSCILTMLCKKYCQLLRRTFASAGEEEVDLEMYVPAVSYMIICAPAYSVARHLLPFCTPSRLSFRHV